MSASERPFTQSQALGVRVSECSMWRNPDPGSSEQAVEVTVEIVIPEPDALKAAGDGPVDVTLRVAMEFCDSGDARVPRFRVSVRVAALLAPLIVDDGWSGWQPSAARRDAAVLLYPRAQSYLAVLAGMGGVVPIDPPPIDIAALVADADAAADRRT